MNTRNKLWVPMTLGLAITACSTTRQEQDVSQLDRVVEPTEVVVADALPVTELPQVVENERLIAQLQQKIVENERNIQQLNRDLDERDTQIGALEASSADRDSQALLQLEQLRQERDRLEERNAILLLENNSLKDQLQRLERENQQLRQRAASSAPTKIETLVVPSVCEPDTDSVAVCESVAVPSPTICEPVVAPEAPIVDCPTLSCPPPTVVMTSCDVAVVPQNQTDCPSITPAAAVEDCRPIVQVKEKLVYQTIEDTAALMALQQRYQVLDADHTQLQYQHQQLDSHYHDLRRQHDALETRHSLLTATNRDLQKRYEQLKQQNLDLGGSIADARAQHQVLWDRIAVQDKVIASLEAEQANLLEQNRQQSALLLQAKQNAVPMLSTATLVQDTPAAEVSSDTEVQAVETAEWLELRQKNQQLEAKVSRLQAEIEAQQSLLNDYQTQLSQLSIRQASQADVKQQLAQLQLDLEALNATNQSLELQLADVESTFAQSVLQEQQLQAQLVALNSEKNALAIQLAEVLKREQDNVAQRRLLEQQINVLIPFEAELEALEQDLSSGLRNVTWQRPQAMALNNAFEIIVTAQVENPVVGQIYVAELIPDSSFELISAAVAEARVADAGLQWRWRITGLSEQSEARVDLFIHQQIQYREARISRQVYRDQTLVALTNDNLWQKYGYWSLAVLASLIGGFFIGRIGTPRTPPRPSAKP